MYFQVFAGCLHSNGEGAHKLRSEVANGQLHVIQLDVTSEEQIQKSLKYVKANLNGNR